MFVVGREFDTPALYVLLVSISNSIIPEIQKRTTSANRFFFIEKVPRTKSDCLGLALEDVHASALLVLDFTRINGLMDQI
ncbi:hypothetical protein TNCV_281591 [Trichonephila clavipes]|nr:hypothetical protein TNCV_281591 [Trichonephila clavipes]